MHACTYAITHHRTRVNKTDRVQEKIQLFRPFGGGRMPNVSNRETGLHTLRRPEICYKIIGGLTFLLTAVRVYN